MPPTKKDVPIRDLAHVITFGKYKGWSIEQVLDEDPQYVEWAVGERIFVLTEEADDALQDALYNKDEKVQDTYDRFTKGE